MQNAKSQMIAIVDDDKAVRDALEMLMRSLGHNASKFGSAEEFLAFDKLYDTSCLITDVQMPGLTGIDLQDRLNADGCRIPIIFITGYPDDTVRARAMKAGALGFLVKPVDANHLIGCIEKVLQAA
jgi:FixJ family two-component response regulator